MNYVARDFDRCVWSTLPSRARHVHVSVHVSEGLALPATPFDLQRPHEEKRTTRQAHLDSRLLCAVSMSIFGCCNSVKVQAEDYTIDLADLLK